MGEDAAAVQGAGNEKKAALEVLAAAQENAANMHETHFKRLLDLACEFDALCKEHGLTYYLAFGTLLGAVRHKGFIPWDHDIDLWMPWSDYCKLRKLFDEGKGPEGRALEDRWSLPNFSHEFGRYTDLTSTRMNPKNPRGVLEGDHDGIFIDVFPLVPVRCSSFEDQERIYARFVAFSELRNGLMGKTNNRSDAFIAEWKRCKASVEEKGLEVTLAELEESLFSTLPEEATHYLYLSSGTPYGWIFQRKYFEGSQSVEMEGYSFSAPLHLTELLTQIYGSGFRNYPSSYSNETGKHIYTSEKVPCSYSMEEIAEELDLEQLEKDRRTLKPYTAEETVRFHELVSEELELLSLQQRMHVDLRARELGTTPEQAYEQHDWQALDAMFESYYEASRGSGYSPRRVYIPLPASELKAAVMNLLCNRGNEPFAYALVRKRYELGGPLSEEEEELRSFVLEVNAIRDSIEAGDFAQGRQHVDAVLAAEPDVLDAQCADLWLRLQDSKGNAAAQQETASSAKERFEANGYVPFLLVQALALREAGDAASALPLFERFKELSTDGMALRYIDDLLGGGAHA